MTQLLINSLLKPQAYPDRTKSVHLKQTHISFLFFTDTFVYKIKKPVDFGFLNFTTLDRRRFYCDEEVRLNRRLCPDIYLGVVEVRESPAGIIIDGEGRIVDYAVKMKKLPEERMLARLLTEGKVTDADMQRIGRTIADFHLNIERNEEIDSYGNIENIRRNWDENLQQLSAFTDITLSMDDIGIIRNWLDNYLNQHRTLFTNRVSEGFIRECDGDIHTENICLTDTVYIFVCIEFNKRFRYSDTAADIAFLLMDLDYHGKSFFASTLLDEYMTATGDHELPAVVDFYKVYRAVVRGKVESFRLFDENIPSGEKAAARDRAIRYFRLARGYIIRHNLPPTLILTCGLMGSGKSAIASWLGFELGIETVAADVVRKELSGRPANAHDHNAYGEGLYTPAFNDATYAELLNRGGKTLQAGKSIIIDATFRRKADRERFRNLAEKLGCGCLILQTTCPEKIIRQRLDSRTKDPTTVSDGRWELFHKQKTEFEPVTADEGKTIHIATTSTIFESVDKVLTEMGLIKCGQN